MNTAVKHKEANYSHLICDICRRVCEFTDDDEYRCRRGLTKITKGKVKCKYFKRHPKYTTITGASKRFESYDPKTGISIITRYKDGKLKSITHLGHPHM